MPDWKKRVDDAVTAIADEVIRKYARANADSVIAAIDGRGPDDPVSDPAFGARVVYNIAAVHVAPFCQESTQRIAAFHHRGREP